jgi:hypothetical protein
MMLTMRFWRSMSAYWQVSELEVAAIVSRSALSACEWINADVSTA